MLALVLIRSWTKQLYMYTNQLLDNQTLTEALNYYKL